MQAKLEIGPRGAGVTWNVGPHIILFPAVSSRSAGRSSGAPSDSGCNLASRT